MPGCSVACFVCLVADAVTSCEQKRLRDAAAFPAASAALLAVNAVTPCEQKRLRDAAAFPAASAALLAVNAVTPCEQKRLRDGLLGRRLPYSPPVTQGSNRGRTCPCYPNRRRSITGAAPVPNRPLMGVVPPVFPQGKIKGERPRQGGRSPSFRTCSKQAQEQEQLLFRSMRGRCAATPKTGAHAPNVRLLCA